MRRFDDPRDPRDPNDPYDPRNYPMPIVVLVLLGALLLFTLIMQAAAV